MSEHGKGLMGTAVATKTRLSTKARIRQEALERIERQVAEGTLTIRQMTPEERLRFPRRPDTTPRRRRRS